MQLSREEKRENRKIKGAKLRRIREELHYSQEQLAQSTNHGSKSISHWENGIHDAPESYCSFLAVLGCYELISITDANLPLKRVSQHIIDDKDFALLKKYKVAAPSVRSLVDKLLELEVRR